MDEDAFKVYARWNQNLFESRWRGELAAKNPCDAWVSQEIIHKCKPDIIIETGSFRGGSALMLADMMSFNGVSEIISVDAVAYNNKKDDRITWLFGSSTNDLIVAQIKERCANKKVMIILDSDHASEHVAEELRLFSPLVSSGQYLIVEDTWWNYTNEKGPREAVDAFMKGNKDFVVDKHCERYLLTNNPGGFLKRK